MEAINNYVLLEDVTPKELAPGIILPEETDPKMIFKKGKVISAGPKAEGIKKGDFVIYDKRAVLPYKEYVDGKQVILQFIPSVDIYGAGEDL